MQDRANLDGERKRERVANQLVSFLKLIMKEPGAKVNFPRFHKRPKAPCAEISADAVLHHLVRKLSCMHHASRRCRGPTAVLLHTEREM